MKRFARSPVFLPILMLLAACSGGTGGGGGNGGGSSTTSGSTTSGSTTSESTTSGSTTSGSTTSGNTTSGSGTGCGEKPAGLRCYQTFTYSDPTCEGGQWKCLGPQACGASTDPACPDGQLCFDEQWTCGSGSNARCLPAYSQVDCDKPGSHVACGCDGMVYADACAAHDTGLNVTASGKCAVPNGMFQCGYRFCQRHVEYCSYFGGDQDYIGTYACVAVPAGTCPGATLSCACFDPGEECEDDGDGGLIASSYN